LLFYISAYRTTFVHSALLSQAGLTIDLLRQTVFRSSSFLHYRGGDCTWKIPGLFGQVITLTGPHIELMGLDTTVEIICEVNGTVLLQADIINHGI